MLQTLKRSWTCRGFEHRSSPTSFHFQRAVSAGEGGDKIILWLSMDSWAQFNNRVMGTQISFPLNGLLRGIGSSLIRGYLSMKRETNGNYHVQPGLITPSTLMARTNVRCGGHFDRAANRV